MGLFGKKKNMDVPPPFLTEEGRKLFDQAKKENDARFVMPRPGMNENESRACRFVEDAYKHIGISEDLGVALFQHYYHIEPDRARQLFSEWVKRGK